MSHLHVSDVSESKRYDLLFLHDEWHGHDDGSEQGQFGHEQHETYCFEKRQERGQLGIRVSAALRHVNAIDLLV